MPDDEAPALPAISAAIRNHLTPFANAVADARLVAPEADGWLAVVRKGAVTLAWLDSPLSRLAIQIRPSILPPTPGNMYGNVDGYAVQVDAYTAKGGAAGAIVEHLLIGPDEDGTHRVDAPLVATGGACPPTDDGLFTIAEPEIVTDDPRLLAEQFEERARVCWAAAQEAKRKRDRRTLRHEGDAWSEASFLLSKCLRGGGEVRTLERLTHGTSQVRPRPVQFFPVPEEPAPGEG